MSRLETKLAGMNQRLRWSLADMLADEHLGIVNATSRIPVPADSFYTRYGKRTGDVLLSGVALTLSFPVVLAAALAVTATDGGKPMFIQERVGKDGRVFRMIKLRTMREASDNEGRPLLGSERVTRVGALLRRLSVDELPNLWNIFIGDMSIVGPRPLLKEYRDRYSDRHQCRHHVRPGLDCPAQSPGQTITSYEQQFEHDIWYVENVSLRTDLRLMKQIVMKAVGSSDSSVRTQSSRGPFMGYSHEGKAIALQDVPEWAVDQVLAAQEPITSSSKTEVEHLG